MDEVKLYDPQERVAISLTNDQWRKILNSLKNDADRNHARMIAWLGNCADQRTAAETARGYEEAYKELDALRAEIERILLEPWTPKPAPDDEEE